MKPNRLLAHLAGFAAATCFCASFATPAHAATLRSGVVVSGDVVTLGDVFDDAGDAAGIVVAEAPAPGLAANISISRISLAARRNGLAWRNTTRFTHLTVTRAGLPVPEGEIAVAVAEAIMAATPALPVSAKLQVDFSDGVTSIQVGEDAPRTVKVERIAFNPRSGAFDALLRAPANDPASPLRRLSGRAYPAVDVPVPTRDIPAGEVVRSRDIEWIRLPTSRVGQNIATTEAQLVGMAPRHPLRAGEPLRTSDVAPPIVVAKGAQVDMTYVSGALTLVARGRALQAGAVGDTVDILNLRSKRTVQGVIERSGIVRIDAFGAPRTADLKS